MAYENQVSPATKPQSAMESMLGQANCLQTMANDLFNRLEKMDIRVHGNHPTPIGAQAGIPKTSTP